MIQSLFFIAIFLVFSSSTFVYSYKISGYAEYQAAIQQANAKVTSENGILIVGGVEAPKGKYPYIAGMRSSASGRSFCGGSLISKRFVLTAAHCGNIPFVSVGTHFLSGRSDGVQLRVVRRIRHPSYDSPVSMAYDFALLELEKDITSITPVALAAASGSNDSPGLIANAQGWGYTSEGGSQSSVLRHVNVPLLSNRRCSRKLNGIHSSMICAGGKRGKDSCQGDSGGPLTITKGKKQVLVGVVSWGIGCAREGYPGVYSRVSSARQWIDANSIGHRWI